MRERQPTPEQAAAIEFAGSAVMIEAGAGAGKTGVMVERYCRLVCDEGVAIDEILMITFTDKAAAELRQRIRAELAARADGGSERARALLGSLGGAWITTIHGFCHRLLSSHPVAAGVDPRFQVLDAAEADRAAREAFDEALEEFMAGEDRAREETVAAYGIDALRGMVVAAHEELRSRGFAEPSLPEPPPPDVPGALREAERIATETLAELSEKSRARPLVERAIDALTEGGEEVGLDEIAELRSSGTAKEMVAYRDAIEAAIARVAEADEGGAAYSHAAELLRLFSTRFAAVKERRGGIDFEDLQLLVAGLLDRDEVGGAYRSRFSHLMVDEFQDTNRLQVRLIESLRGPKTTLMVVGDALQSIYGFRHADLDAYREQREAIDAGPGSQVIELTGNFRSNPEVIGAVNALGERLIGDDYRPLRVGAESQQGPDSDDPAVELLLTACKGWDELELEPAVDSATPPHYLAESRILAERLRDLADAGVPRGEMVVLLRAFTHLDAYEDSLSRAGMRPYVVGGRGYWSQQQVSDVSALLAVLANPLDDQALFGALASPACGVAPDTLWLLRAASGPDRHVWPALETAVGLGENAVESPDRLEQIAERDLSLMRRFAETVDELRERGSNLPLADLIDRAVTATGYDLAVLLKPAGEARFANVRKLMQIAEAFESREGRDLRGLLDFLAFQEEAADESAASTAAEDHDGVRIMSIHRAKGLEFGVVAVPHLDRSLLAGTWPPLLTFGRGDGSRVGMQLRRLGARAINLFDHRQLREETNERDAKEGLRLFHVAATRARDRLVLSGVVRESTGELKPSTSVVERIVSGFEVDRAADSVIDVAAPLPRPGLDRAFEPSRIRVHVNLPSPERAAQLVGRRPAPALDVRQGVGPAPLLERRAQEAVPGRPLSYTVLSDELERISSRIPGTTAFESEREPLEVDRDTALARGIAVHGLLEWSANNGWREPSPELTRRFAGAAGLDLNGDAEDALLGPAKSWLGSDFFAERVRSGGRARAELPILVRVADTVLRGSIDLLVEGDGAPPLIVDYKTDRVDGSEVAEVAARYEIQQAIYALAVAEARRTQEVELGYIFLERPEEPFVELWGPDEIDQGRRLLEAAIAQVRDGRSDLG
jgi:ATP-dependent exoDNAse (exonuclease V) beta subunit